MVETEKIDFIKGQSTAQVDLFFNLKPISEVEREGHESLYLSGVTSEALYTSYQDLLEVMPWLYKQGARTWCDVGCGVGRSCLLWSWLTQERAIGIELVPERIEEARAACRSKNLSQIHWIEGDFSSPSRALPESDVYFLYLATGPQLDALLAKIKKRSTPSWVVVIESHGDLKPRLQWEAWWLAPTANRFSLKSFRHDPWVQVYKTRPDHPVFHLEDSWETKSGLLPQDLALHPNPLGYLLTKSFLKNWEIVIDERGEKWTMETIGLAWHDMNTVQGHLPPRQVSWSRENIGLRRIPEEGQYAQWSAWRREERLFSYLTHQGISGQRVKLRKIIISPYDELEFSDGVRVKWEDIKKWEELK
ncbi:MAG: class I SAM-dependent methyltransferase [Bacteriovoracaceae bacterium]|nr:class I SAM-dependent methyltransferase [Bacteriovoracaceae bacterium]